MDKRSDREVLAQAYQETQYVALDPQGREHILVADRANPFDHSWAYITAENPRSRPLSPSENTERTARLIQQVEHAGFEYWRGEGRGTDGDWPPEQSLLIFDIPNEEARRLAVEFDQNAYVYSNAGGQITIEWTR